MERSPFAKVAVLLVAHEDFDIHDNGVDPRQVVKKAPLALDHPADALPGIRMAGRCHDVTCEALAWAFSSLEQKETTVANLRKLADFLERLALPVRQPIANEPTSPDVTSPTSEPVKEDGHV
jgi:hypothetical protein